MAKPEDKTILVVDDEPDVRMYVSAALEDAGFNVVSAANGHEAYNRVKEKRPDFITLDLVMPKQSGALFYLKLRKNKSWQSIPVMIISAHAHDELGDQDFKRLMKGQEAPRPEFFMEKPVNPVELVRQVAEALAVEVEGLGDTSTEDERGEVITRLRTADLSTLRKVKDVLEDS